MAKAGVPTASKPGGESDDGNVSGAVPCGSNVIQKFKFQKPVYERREIVNDRGVSSPGTETTKSVRHVTDDGVEVRCDSPRVCDLSNERSSTLTPTRGIDHSTLCLEKSECGSMLLTEVSASGVLNDDAVSSGHRNVDNMKGSSPNCSNVLSNNPGGGKLKVQTLWSVCAQYHDHCP